MEDQAMNVVKICYSKHVLKLSGEISHSEHAARVNGNNERLLWQKAVNIMISSCLIAADVHFPNRCDITLEFILGDCQSAPFLFPPKLEIVDGDLQLFSTLITLFQLLIMNSLEKDCVEDARLAS